MDKQDVKFPLCILFLCLNSLSILWLNLLWCSLLVHFRYTKISIKKQYQTKTPRRAEMGSRKPIKNLMGLHNKQTNNG